MAQEEIEVEILRRVERMHYPSLTEAIEMVEIHYLAPDQPPRVIRIPKAEYSPEKEEEAIREDIKRMRERKVERKIIRL